MSSAVFFIGDRDFFDRLSWLIMFSSDLWKDLVLRLFEFNFLLRFCSTLSKFLILSWKWSSSGSSKFIDRRTLPRLTWLWLGSGFSNLDKLECPLSALLVLPRDLIDVGLS